jgi:hypothetical protein
VRREKYLNKAKKEKERQQNKNVRVSFVTSEPACYTHLFIFITQGGVSLLLS